MIKIRKMPLIQTYPAEFTGMRAMYGRVFHFSVVSQSARYGIQIEPLLVAPVVALPMLLALLLVLLLSGNKPPHRDDEDSAPN